MDLIFIFFFLNSLPEATHDYSSNNSTRHENSMKLLQETEEQGQWV